MAIFATKAVQRRDARGRSRAQLAADVVDDGIGPEASVWGRDHALEMLTYALLGVFGGAYGCLLTAAMLLRPAIGPVAAGNALAVGAALLFPLAGLVFPLSLRFALARRQLRGWERRGEPEDERPGDASLPSKSDLVVGIALGGTFGLMLVLGIFAD
ncbi:hypothetical protein QUV83_07305 [Cellulomonas cellasea]|uniref:hypothetical protein n=1 Tax=Cellulomonas cellasea TaxID=43670 RepID=UPI0025A364F6|nr:hypothetical protein [Cellulomonas cellasea]MDM8084564.1 hypothetical protein [Cellulomonas cellasea]